MLLHVVTYCYVEVSCAETLALHCCLINVHIRTVHLRAQHIFLLGQIGESSTAHYACLRSKW